jgi:mono/diheme cytochrome c family protein
VAVLALLASGCGYGGVASASDHPDPSNGQTLFTQKCAACHTLAAANASGTVGPDLDNAFAGSRLQGYGSNSIEQIVLDQIELGSGPIADYKTGKEFTSSKCLDPSTQQSCTDPQMPANLYTGQDAIDVAAYVASVAGAGGYTTAACGASLGTDGLTIFQGCGCAGCHTLKAANATGTVGPDLDALKPSESAVAQQVTNGGGVMPSFKDKLTPAQIEAVAKYVSSAAAGG